MATKIEIINRGFALVGLKKITSLTDLSPEAEIASQIYPTSLATVLEECAWTFATKRKNLSEVTNNQAFASRSMTHQYTKPADLIKFFKTHPVNAFWSVEGEYILSDNVGLGVI